MGRSRCQAGGVWQSYGSVTAGRALSALPGTVAIGSPPLLYSFKKANMCLFIFLHLNKAEQYLQWLMLNVSNSEDPGHRRRWCKYSRKEFAGSKEEPR